VIYGPELGRKHNLEAPSLTLGRSNKCDIQIDQESDLGSTNGTMVNGYPVSSTVVRPGDVIVIGDCRITVEAR